jgi:hypothetical protein
VATVNAQAAGSGRPSAAATSTTRPRSDQTLDAVCHRRFSDERHESVMVGLLISLELANKLVLGNNLLLKAARCGRDAFGPRPLLLWLLLMR